MKIKIALFALIIFHISVCQSICTTLEKTVHFAGQWPYHPAKAIAVDPDRSDRPDKNIVFMGVGESLSILDTDLNLIKIFSVTDSGQIGGIFYAASDRILYVACKNDGLQMIDVSDTENPFKTGAYYYTENESVEINGVYVENQTAYLACGLAGVIILDVSDPKNPSLLSTLGLYGAWGLSYALDIHTSECVSGKYAWVADLYNGINVININDLKNPESKNIIPLPGASDLAVSDSYLYVALQGNGMEIIDISTPEDFQFATVFLSDGIEDAVRVDGDTAYIAYEPNGLKALDISNKHVPFHDPAWTYTDAGALSIGLLPEENALFITSNQVGMQKIDVADKADMHLLASYDPPGDAVAVDVSGDYIYALDDNAGNSPESEGLRIHKFSTLTHAVQFFFTGFCATPGTANNLFVSGDYVYVADGDHGLQIINSSDKTNPEIVGSVTTISNAKGIFVDGNHGYVVNGTGLSIIDITDKSNPTLISSLDTPGNANDVFIAHGYAYIADGDHGLAVLDLSDKTNPEIIETASTAGTANGIFIRGDYVYVANGSQGMAIFDITDKTNPEKISSFSTGGDAKNISVSGTFAYVAAGEKGICVIDISDPALPVEERNWSYDSTGSATDIYSGYTSADEGMYAFIADGHAGIIAINPAFKLPPEGIDTGGGGGCFIQTLGVK